MYTNEEKHFTKCVKMNKKTIIDLRGGINTLKVLIKSKNQ